MPQLPASFIVMDSDSRPYWDGLKQGELRIQYCSDCSRYVFYPRSLCPYCHSTQLSWEVASGQGTIYTYTIVHQGFGAFAAEVPFIVALVELEEGVRMMSRIVDAPRERVSVGAAVHVIFQSVAEDLTLPYFRLVE